MTVTNVSAPYRSAWVLLGLCSLGAGGCLLVTSLSGFDDGPRDVPDARSDRDADPIVQDATTDVPSVDARAVVPITFRQANATSDSNSVSSLSTAFNGAVTARGAIIVCLILGSQSTLSQITDTRGNTYATVLGPWDTFGGYRSYIALAQDVGGGPDTVSAQVSPATTMELYVHEYAGLATSGAFDKSSSRNGSSSTTDGMESGFVTTSFDQELIFGFAVTNTAALGTGFNLRSSFNNNVIEDKVVTTKGSYQATATMTAGTAWAMMVATFRGQ
jgi:hypothetical protein